MREADESDIEQPGGQPDPWAGFLPGQDLVPAYLASHLAAQYRAIVDVVLDAQDRSLTGLAFDDVHAALRTGLTDRLGEQVADDLLGSAGFDLDARLDRLVRWGVLTRWQDAARSGDDFLRRRDRYQLTPQAARLHAFWLQGPEDEAASADLTLAPRAILDRLTAFADAVRAQHYPTAAAEYQQVLVLHHGMAVAARGWQRNLAHALSGAPDPDKQDALWQTLQSYIGAWGEQVDGHSPRIRDLLADLTPELTEPIWRACVQSALSDGADDALVHAQADRWATTWRSLHAWFGHPDGQARRLRRQLRDLVAPWARNMRILMDTGGAVTRRAELLELAAAIERAPDDGTAWAIWQTAAGLFPARRLMLAPEVLDADYLSWAQAPPAPVTARFRLQGPKAAVGRRPAATDYSSGRRASRRSRLTGQALRAEAEAALRTRSGTRLGDWHTLTEPELDLLLELLGTARRGTAGSARSAVTSDGRWRVTLAPTDHGPGVAVIRTPRGRFTGPDWEFRLEPAG